MKWFALKYSIFVVGGLLLFVGTLCATSGWAVATFGVGLMALYRQWHRNPLRIHYLVAFAWMAAVSIIDRVLPDTASQHDTVLSGCGLAGALYVLIVLALEAWRLWWQAYRSECSHKKSGQAS